MKILLNECVPIQVSGFLTSHEVQSVVEKGWQGLSNGDLLEAAEKEGFDRFIIADKNMRHQQNLSRRRLAILELWTNHRPTLERHVARIGAAVEGISPGQYATLEKS
jgi:hypothetical protein